LFSLIRGPASAEKFREVSKSKFPSLEIYVMKGGYNGWYEKYDGVENMVWDLFFHLILFPFFTFICPFLFYITNYILQHQIA
jgi:hypothetical protein